MRISVTSMSFFPRKMDGSILMVPKKRESLLREPSIFMFIFVLYININTHSSKKNSIFLLISKQNFLSNMLEFQRCLSI